MTDLDVSGWGPNMLGPVVQQAAGVAHSPARGTWNWIGVTLADDTVNERTNFTVNTSSLSGLGAGVGTWLATPSSANLAAALTDETGTGSAVFGTSPTFKTSIVLRNPADTFSYTITPGALAASYALNLPVLTGADTVAVLALAQTLSNKTLAAPTLTGVSTIAALSGSDENNALAGTQNNVAIGSVTRVRVTDAGAVTWTGIAGGTAGRMLMVTAVGAGGLTIEDESISGTSSDANRCLFVGAASLVLAQYRTALLTYDATLARWVGGLL